MSVCPKHTTVDISKRKCVRCTVEKRAATMMERYGVAHPLQSKELHARWKKTRDEKYGEDFSTEAALRLKEAAKKRCMEKYGVECTLMLKEVREKGKKTCLAKYGAEHAIQSAEIKEKRVKTNRKLFGADNPLQNKEVLAKRKRTCLAKYGTDETLKLAEVREKGKVAMIETYGVENPLQSDEIKERRALTCIEKYGTSNLMHVPEIFEKKSRGKFQRKECTMPSGEKRTYQGYENVALLQLVKTYKEEQILNKIVEMPDIRYEFNSKKCRYYPDIYIPDEKKIIEVKSEYTYKMTLEQNLCKKKACEDAGYTFEFWICNKKAVVDKR
jgi:hypothetical protein